MPLIAAKFKTINKKKKISILDSISRKFLFKLNLDFEKRSKK